MRVLSIVVLLAILPAAFCAPQSYPPPAGTTIENARVNPPFWQDNVACNVDTNIPHYTPHYNLTAIANLNQTYRLSTADVTGPLNENVTSKFLAYWPTVNIIPYHYGSGSVGLCLAGKNTTVAANNLPYCDMAVISREIAPVTTSSTELENFEYKLGYQPMEVPVMGGSYNALGFEDALLFFVNGANPLRNVSLAQLDAIISTTRNRGYPNPIRTWDQLGVTDPAYFNQTINVYSSTLGNGFNVFINRVVMQGGTWYTGNLNQSSTVFPLGTYVTLDKFGLGFSGVSYLNQSGITVNVNVLNLAWGNNCTAVPVSQPTVCARTWPLSRFIYYYANLVPGTTLDPVEYEYLNYLLSYEGQTIMRQAQGGVYFPLPYATLMDIRSRFLVINNPPAFVDGTGSLYFNQTTYCPGTAPVTTTTPFPSNTTAPPTSGAAPKAPALQWILSSALLAILSWMAATMK